MKDGALGQAIEVPAGVGQVLGPLAYSVIIPLLGRTSDSAPDPEMAKLRARIAEQRETGEWEPPTDAGVVVVALGEPVDVKAVTDELTQRTAAKPVFFSTLAFVVLRWKVNAGMRQISSGAILPHGNALPPAALRLARVLVAGTP